MYLILENFLYIYSWLRYYDVYEDFYLYVICKVYDILGRDLGF